MKRLFDFCCAAAGLLLLSPLLLLIAAAVALDSRGPVIFRQQRVGRGSRLFWILKFRSMQHRIQPAAGLLTVGADPRVTRTGRFLRAAKLDELPQLFNVLKGDMSLVGPRPEVPRYVEHYTVEQRQVLTVRPGITDLASIEYRDESRLLGAAADPEKLYLEEIMPHKLELNLRYVAAHNVGGDVRIILRTVALIAFA